MINLILKEEKKKMILGFYYRLVVLFFMTLGFCFLILSISIASFYFISSIKNNLINLKLETQKSNSPSLSEEQPLAIIRDTNNKLDLLENAQKDKFSVSNKVINAILLKKRSDIKITQILYENESTKGGKINITGTAPSREVLLLFRRALEDSSNFKSIDLPISNFIKGSNIKFYLSLIPT